MTTTVVEHRYRPRGACARLMECRAPEVLLSGPAGTGKSRACLTKLHLLALKYPGMRGLILRKTQRSLSGTALVTWREHVAAEGLAGGVLAWYGGSEQVQACYRYANGSVIGVGGLDEPTKIMSSEYDVAYVMEAIELREHDWETVTTRLRNGRMPYQQLMADTNPDRPTHWLKVRCDAGRTLLMESRHEDNPVYFDDAGAMTAAGHDYIEGKLDALTGPRKARLRGGLWVAAEGVIFEEFDPAVHLVDRFEIPAEWTRWWVIDFGFVNPFVCQFWAEDPDGRLYLYREIYRTKKTVDQHAADILATVRRPVDDLGREADPLRHADWEWTEPKPRTIICDHDAGDRALLERHLNLGTTAATKGVDTGLQLAQGRWRRAGDGRPRMMILRDSLVHRDADLEAARRPCCTAEEIPGYIWDATKEKPIKEDDHGCDCLRYLSAERAGDRPRVRMLTA